MSETPTDKIRRELMRREKKDFPKRVEKTLERLGINDDFFYAMKDELANTYVYFKAKDYDKMGMSMLAVAGFLEKVAREVEKS